MALNFDEQLGCEGVAAAAAAAAAADFASRTKPLFVSVLECPHVIVADEIILSFDSKQPGHNALNQLHRRLDAAATARESALVAERDRAQQLADSYAEMVKTNQALIEGANVLKAQVVAERDALRAALLQAARDVEGLKRPVHMDDPDSPQAARNSLYMSIAAKARAALSATAVEGV